MSNIYGRWGKRGLDILITLHMIGSCLDTGAWKNALRVRINPPQYIYNVGGNYDSLAEGLEIVKELLTDGYILLIGTYISSWQYGTIADDPSTFEDDSEVGKSIGYWVNGTEGAHGMVIVGYNDEVWTDIIFDDFPLFCLIQNLSF